MIAQKTVVQIVLTKEEEIILKKAQNMLIQFQNTTSTENQIAIENQIEDYCGCADGIDMTIDVLNYLINYSIKN